MLIELQRRTRDESARMLARARREAATAGSTLQMLRDYGTEHTSRAPGKGAPAFPAGSLKIRDAFGQRLTQAIGEQDAVTQRLEAAAVEREQGLRERQSRLDALEGLLRRREAENRQRADRQEQGQTDEFALQSFLRARKDGSR